MSRINRDAHRQVVTINYAFSEDKVIRELQKYVDDTYDQHYAQRKYQSTEFIEDCGQGEGFCLGNILKYTQRYGRKNGNSRADLMKILHYGIIMLHIHDQENYDEVK